MATTPARSVVLGSVPPTPDEVVAVARDGARVELSEVACAAIARSRAHVEAAAAAGARPIYGVTTGFGALANTRIPSSDLRELQYALVRSTAAGMGPPLPGEVVRAMMFLRARTLALGFSGVRPELVRGFLALLNAGITPYVPCYGSLGASGDLAPLAHAAVVLIGEGLVLGRDGRPRPAADALGEAGVAPLQLEAKEGLSLVNGTDGMLGMLVMACRDALRLFRTADVACAMSVEALLGTDRAFQPELHAIRPHPGQRASAANLARLLEGSPLVHSHRESDHAVQDAYSLRCHPQVMGAARDTLAFAEQVAERELASVTDNPVVLPDGRVESGGNFHGEPLAFACDFLAIAAAEVGSIAERRVDRLLDHTRSQGLPAFLSPDPGLNSGLMIAQYTAAALVAENRRLAAPASVDSIPTSGMQEDHVSMGWGAALKLRAALGNLARIVAIETLCATHGLALRRPVEPGAATGRVSERVLSEVAGPGPDRILAPDLAALERLVAQGEVLAAAESAAGGLD
jgi:histidine ammonia-lyase